MTTSLTARTLHVEGDTDLKVLSRWFPAADFKASKGTDQARVRDLLVEAGRTRIPEELKTLSRRW